MSESGTITPQPKPLDPTLNVRELINDAVGRLDDLRETETQRVNEKFADSDIKYQIQFTAAKEAVGIASTAQEKLVAQALDGTKEAISKADINTDKRFDLLSEKIDGITNTMNKNTGERGIYVTHVDLNIAMDKLQTSIEATLRPVVTFMNNQTGKSGGLSQSWAILIGAVGVIGGIVAIASRFIN